MVYPDGTGTALAPDLRTWNAGGGDGGWQCVSGNACSQGVDELGYFTDLLADLRTAFRIDGDHLFATGISNGGAMSQRLACTLAHVAAIAPVAGANQYATTQPCSSPVPVLEIHGTQDPCWPYEGGEVSCLDSKPGAKIGVASSISGWVVRNGCEAAPSDVALPDTVNDGTSTVKHTYRCSRAALEFYEIADGGHTWPGGYQYFGPGLIGLTSQDFSANIVILDFFAAHR
jgi:polyhydroxybutyrate depolymerase